MEGGRRTSSVARFSGPSVERTIQWRHMITMVSQNTGNSIVCSILCLGLHQISRNKTLTGDRWIPSQRASNADFDVSLMAVSISCSTNCRMTGDLELHAVMMSKSTKRSMLFSSTLFPKLELRMSTCSRLRWCKAIGTTWLWKLMLCPIISVWWRHPYNHSHN